MASGGGSDRTRRRGCVGRRGQAARPVIVFGGAVLGVFAGLIAWELFWDFFGKARR